MTDIDTGLFMGGAARQRIAERELGLRERAIGVQENQLAFQQQIEQRNQITEAVGNTIDQMINFIGQHPNRSSPAFREGIDTFRRSILGIVSQPAAQNVGINPESVMTTFNNAVASTQTATERAQAESQAQVSGAQATVEGLAALPADQQGQVGQLLGLTEPRQTQEFFGLLPLLDDPSLTPEQRDFVTGRLNNLTQNNQLGLVFSSDAAGNITVAQVPAGEAGLTSRLMGTGQTLDRLRSQTDVLRRGISIANALVDNPAPLGITADVRNVYERLSGAIADLTGVSGSDLQAEFQALMNAIPHDEPDAFSIGELEAAEGFLLFSVARALQPAGERLLAPTLERARSLTDLGGVTSDEEVRRRLSTIVTILESAQADVTGRMQQAVGGTATVERRAPIEASPAEEAEGTLDTIEDLLDQLDRLLNGG